MKGVVLAAGLGTRFKSEKSKLLHPLLGKPVIWHTVNSLKRGDINDITLVISEATEEIKGYLEDVDYVYQENPKGGTGDALLSFLKQNGDYHGYLFVINGDTPLVKPETIKNMIAFLNLTEEYEGIKPSGIVMTASIENPYGYGRVIKDDENHLVAIREEKDATEKEREIKEVNSGVYILKKDDTEKALKAIKPSKVTGELYLTEALNYLAEKGLIVKVFNASEPTEILGINTRLDLAIAESVLRIRINLEWMERGVTIHSPETVWIEPKVEIDKDVEIFPNAFLKGKTKIGKNAVIGTGSVIEDTIIEEGVTVEPYTIIKNSTIKEKAVVGPFAHVRENTIIGEGSHIGNFVEVKKCTIERDVKAKHLSYLGDATVGRGTNIGAGTVTANYDGKKKHKTNIGEQAFIGSNSLLIAPINIGSLSYIAGGSVINKDVPEGSLAVERAELKILKDKGRKKLQR